MKIIQFKETFDKLNAHINQYNKKQKHKGCEIRPQHTKTAEELIKIFAAELNLAFRFKRVTIEAFLVNLPPLKTNGEQLASLVGCTSRTIRNHIKRLQLAEIITSKKFKGTNCDYEVIINPEIIAFVTSFLPDGCETFPLTKDLKDNKNINNNEKVISNSCLSLKEHLSNEHTHFSLQKVVNSNLQQELKIEYAIAPVSPAAANGKVGKVNNNSIFTEKQNANKSFLEEYQEKKKKIIHGGLPDRIVYNYVEMLWLFIKNILYFNMDLTKNQIEIGKKYLYVYFMSAKSEKTLVMWSGDARSRVMKTAKYLEKYQKKPYIPSNYLNPENKNGFAGTKVWLDEDKIKGKIFKKHGIKDLYFKKITNAYIRNYLHKSENKNGIKKIDDFSMFTKCLHQIERGPHPELADTFLNAIMEDGYMKNFTKKDVNINN